MQDGVVIITTMLHLGQVLLQYLPSIKQVNLRQQLREQLLLIPLRLLLQHQVEADRVLLNGKVLNHKHQQAHIPLEQDGRVMQIIMLLLGLVM